MELCGLPCSELPVIEGLGLITGAVQVYCVPVGTPDGLMVKALPVQIVANCAGTVGVGLRSTLTVCELEHPLAVIV